MAKQNGNLELWYYFDQENQVQGPYDFSQMEYWIKQNYFEDNLVLFSNCCFNTLGELKCLNGADTPLISQNFINTIGKIAIEHEKENINTNGFNQTCTTSDIDDDDVEIIRYNGEGNNITKSKVVFRTNNGYKSKSYEDVKSAYPTALITYLEAQYMKMLDENTRLKKELEDKNNVNESDIEGLHMDAFSLEQSSSSGSISTNKKNGKILKQDFKTSPKQLKEEKPHCPDLDCIRTKKILEETKLKLQSSINDRAQLESLLNENQIRALLADRDDSPNNSSDLYSASFPIGKRFFFHVCRSRTDGTRIIKANEYCRDTKTKRYMFFSIEAAVSLAEVMGNIAFIIGEVSEAHTSDYQFDESFESGGFMYAVKSQAPSLSTYELATFVVYKEHTRNSTNNSYINIPATGIYTFIQELKAVLKFVETLPEYD